MQQAQGEINWGKWGAYLGLAVGFIVLFTKPAFLSVHATTPSIKAHTVPVESQGIALRWAMVYDILHERYPRHSTAWYTARNTATREAITKHDSGPEQWMLIDDLAMGLERLGHSDEASTLLRQKLADIQATNPAEGPTEEPKSDHILASYQPRDLQWMHDADAPPRDPATLHRYKTYANLGTVLIHHGFQHRHSNAGKKSIRAGLSYIEQAIAINPGAHFGREAWQAAAVHFMLASLENPQLLLRFDITGKPWQNAQQYTSPGEARFRSIPRDRDEREHADVRQRHVWRLAIPYYRPHPDWSLLTGITASIPFDQPILGIMGMWRYGGGPNPHFALALGHLLRDAKQERLAWAAFERTRTMAERFSPDQSIVSLLLEHLTHQQQQLQLIIGENAAELRQRHERSLAAGKSWQQHRQQYEATQLAQGKSVDDPTFFTEFRQQHGTITSPVGTVELTLRRDDSRPQPLLWLIPLVSALLGAGIGIWFRLLRRRSS